jgi:hypothetical protein
MPRQSRFGYAPTDPNAPSSSQAGSESLDGTVVAGDASYRDFPLRRGSTPEGAIPCHRIVRPLKVRSWKEKRERLSRSSPQSALTRTFLLSVLN